MAIRLLLPKLSANSLGTACVGLHRRSLSYLPRLRGFRAAASAQPDAANQSANGDQSNVPTRRRERGAMAPRGRGNMMMSPLLSTPGFGRMGQMMREMEEEMNNVMSLFNDTALPLSSTERPGLGFAVDIHEEDGAYAITADLPGMSKEDIKVTVSPDNLLTISGERKQEKEVSENNFSRIERTFGSFRRSFQLPDNVDSTGIKAKVDSGVLSLRVPKTEKEEHKPVEVPIE